MQYERSAKKLACWSDVDKESNRGEFALMSGGAKQKERNCR